MSGLKQWPIVMAHESSSFYMTSDHFKVQDQNVSLKGQLDKGARSLDIRPHYTTSYELIMAHGPGYFSVTMVQEALQEVKDWIHKHPDEFVVLYILIQATDLISGYPSNHAKLGSVLALSQYMFGSDRAFSNEVSGVRSCSDFNQEVATDSLRGVYMLDDSCIKSGHYNAHVGCLNSDANFQWQSLPVCRPEDWQKLDDYLDDIANSVAQSEGLNILQLHFQGLRARYTDRNWCVNSYIAEKLREPKYVEAFKGRPFFVQIDDIAGTKGGDEVVQAVAAMRAAV